MSALLRRTAPVLAALLAAASLAGEAGAQSILASRGLGYPLPPLDARLRGMGGISTGLESPRLSMVNPADAAGLPAPGLVFTFQPDVYDASAGGVESSGSTARFPLILAGFPIGRRFTGTVGYGSFLDQNWKVEQTDSITLATGRVEVTDRFISRGAISRFRAGGAYRVTDHLAVGLAADAFTGAVHDSSTRVVGGTFPSFSGVRYTYTGVGLTGGARWTTPALTVGAAVSGGGRLNVEASDSLDPGKDYANPLRVDAGASARISQNTVVALSGRWAGWSALSDDLEDSEGARDATGASVGLEYEGLTLDRRVFPVRVGARIERLPFRWGTAATTGDFADERAVSAGVGARLAGGAALLDLAAERGQRGGGSAGFDESFWRFSLSLTLLGR
jgi:hypothetical protein